MASHVPAEWFALRPVFDRRLPDGAWWPESRRLSDQLGRLFSSWPPEEGRIARVLGDLAPASGHGGRHL